MATSLYRGTLQCTLNIDRLELKIVGERKGIPPILYHLPTIRTLLELALAFRRIPIVSSMKITNRYGIYLCFLMIFLTTFSDFTVETLRTEEGLELLFRER